MFRTIQDYLDSLHKELLEVTNDALSYMKLNYPKYQIVLSYQRPMLLIKPKLFIMLGGGKNHFSLYTTDFKYVESFKLKNIPKIKFGKSAILFPLGNLSYKDLIHQTIDEIILRHDV